MDETKTHQQQQKNHHHKKKILPPTFSRLPPDGDEFPPNFTESIKQMNQQELNGTSIKQSSEPPPLPKTVPPKITPRKIYRQDFIIEVGDKRNNKNETIIQLDNNNQTMPVIIEDKTIRKLNQSQSVDSTLSKKIVNNSVELNFKIPELNGVVKKNWANWRKDEKSEKSVRDKIAMFSNGETTPPAEPVKEKSFNTNTVRKTFYHSSDNLIDIPSEEKPIVKKSVEHNENYLSLRTKTDLGDSKTENLTGKVFGSSNDRVNSYNIPKQKISIENHYSSLPRKANNQIISRRTSFSGYTSATTQDDLGKARINTILEQRKKSLTKLRGLVIPEKDTIDSGPILDLPEIKSKDMHRVPIIKKPSNSFQVNPIKSQISSAPTYNKQPSKVPTYNSDYLSIFKRPTPLTTNLENIQKKKEILSQKELPPIKPPRTSLISVCKTTNSHNDEFLEDSEDSSISSTSVSPVKYPLTRTVSSDTNTSIASSTTSTLTSGSGSQASCSSMASTPTIDLVPQNNRRNILQSAKCRSGRDESSSLLVKHRKTDDGDSTDGYEETDLLPKPKRRTSLSNPMIKQKEENLVDRVIKIASYVEVVSDADSTIQQDEEDFNGSEMNKWVINEVKKNAEQIQLNIQAEEFKHANELKEKITEYSKPIISTSSDKQDLQVIIDEADPPLEKSEAEVIVIERDSKDQSFGVTLAGGSDYEAKEITVSICFDLYSKNKWTQVQLFRPGSKLFSFKFCVQGFSVTCRIFELIFMIKGSNAR